MSNLEVLLPLEFDPSTERDPTLALSISAISPDVFLAKPKPGTNGFSFVLATLESSNYYVGSIQCDPRHLRRLNQYELRLRSKAGDTLPISFTMEWVDKRLIASNNPVSTQNWLLNRPILLREKNQQFDVLHNCTTSVNVTVDIYNQVIATVTDVFLFF